MFQPIYKTITTYSSLTYSISDWESKRLSDEKFTPPYTANKSLSPKLIRNESRIRLKFDRSCLKAPFTPINVVNLIIVYELETWSRNLNNDFTLTYCLFGALKLAENVDPDKCKYSGYDIGFDLRSEISLPDGSMGKNSIIFGVNMSSSVHIDNKKKYILILDKGTTQGLNDTMLTSEAQYSIKFSISNRTLCWRLHYNGSNKFLFVNATKIYQFKANDSEIKKYPLCLGNISKDFTAINMKKTGLNGYVQKFSVDFNITDTSNIINIDI